MKNDIEQNDLLRERILWLGALIITAVVFLVIGLSTPLSFSNARNDDRPKITIENATDTTASVDSGAVATSSNSHTSGRININTATVQELMTVPGIGETFAQRIVDYRNLHGGFSSLPELKEIEGIGESRYGNWSPYLTVE